MPSNEGLIARDTPLAVGDPAPDFTLLDQHRSEWTLSAALESSDVVLCFYPMDFSPVCSVEMSCVTDDLARYGESGAQAVGISCDSFFVHEAWAKELGLEHTLLADMHRRVCRAYGLYLPDLNVAARGTYIIRAGPDGPEVRWVEAREIKDAMDRDRVLEALAG